MKKKLYMIQNIFTKKIWLKKIFTPSNAWMLKFLLGNAKTRNASVPIGVASDNLINFSPVRSPRNRHAEKKEEEKNYLQGKENLNYMEKCATEKCSQLM